MARNQGKRFAMGAGLAAVLFLLVLGAGSIINRDAPGTPAPIPDQAIDNTPRASRPAHLSDIQDALQATDRAIVETSWDQAEAHADRAKELWLSYRTPMQASAGRRMWTTSVSQDFQSTLDGLRTDIAAKQSQRARTKIRKLSEMIDMYDDANDRNGGNNDNIGADDDAQRRFQTVPQRD